MSINSRNAAAVAAEMESEIRKAFEENRQAQLAAQAEAEAVPAGGESPEPVALEQAEPEPEPTQESQPEAADDQPDELAKLKREHEILDRNFRNIQRVMTPVWEENSRLRKEVEQLQSSLAGYTEQVETSNKANFSSRLEAIKEAVPEAADEFNRLQQELHSLKEAIGERNRAMPVDPKEANGRAMTQIMKLHPDMTPEELGKDGHPFWDYVESQGPLSQVYKAILASPGTYPDGVQVVDGLMASYKASHTAAPVAAAPAVKKPADVAAPVRPNQSPIDPNATRQKPGLLTDAQIQSLNREVVRASPARAREIQKLIETHLRAASGR